MATAADVAGFLSRFKTVMNFGPFSLVERAKTMKGLGDLGLTINEAKDVITSLTHNNYCCGPEPDRDGTQGEVWVFGADLEGVEAYIKLKLAPDTRKKNVQWAKVLAFHPADRPLTYPLRGGGL